MSGEQPRLAGDDVAAHSVAEPFSPLPADQRAWTRWAQELPVSRTYGLVCASIVPGSVEMLVSATIWPNRDGSAPDGFVIGVADHVMGIAAMTVMEHGQICATATLTCTFHRRAVLPLRLAAEVDLSTPTIAFVDLSILANDDRLCARATGGWSVNRTPPPV